ncbi:hypothetical protein Ciccas_009921 [Cichlidogyrus casuarinus]|uniref:Uncharacterized protein n=1 Tax=Cichlidogyrus casuarinus TaxID=1844966 RepID=A0ABD2PWC9_9PLAT
MAVENKSEDMRIWLPKFSIMSIRMLSVFWILLGLVTGNLEDCSLSFDAMTNEDSYVLSPKPDFKFKMDLQFDSRPDLAAVFMGNQNEEEYQKLVFKTCEVLNYNFHCFNDKNEEVGKGQGKLTIPPTRQQIQVETYPTWIDSFSAKIKFNFEQNHPKGNCNWQVSGTKFTEDLKNKETHGNLAEFS